MASIRLTNDMRDTFIRRVMDDVPSIDYEQKIRDAVNKAAISALPKAVRAIYQDEKLTPYIERHYASVSGGPMRVGFNHLPALNSEELEETANKAAEPFFAPWHAQKKLRDDLSTKLQSVAYHCTTLKALQDAFPEFAQYLPKDEREATRNLPMLANVVTDFVKAGWPKGKKPAQAAKVPA
jgi:hypothetical protein